MNVDTTVALYPGVTGLGLIMPTTTLAERSSVEKRLPLVAAPANGRGGDKRERAVYASKTVIRPLAASGTGEAR